MAKQFYNPHYHVLTGAPGSGKSAVLEVLAKLGYLIMPEVARQILSEQREINGEGVYDKNPFLFKELMLSRAIAYFHWMLDSQKPIFFDRGIPDMLAYSDCFNIPRGAETNASKVYCYNKKAFFMPSWEEIYINDDERQISFEEAKDFGDNLQKIYQALGYQLIDVPRASPKERAQFILNEITSNA